MVQLAAYDCPKVLHAGCEIHIPARHSGKNLRNKKGLRKESLNFACPVDHSLVGVRKLFQSQNSDDVLKLLAPL